MRMERGVALNEVTPTYKERCVPRGSVLRVKCTSCAEHGRGFQVPNDRLDRVDGFIACLSTNGTSLQRSNHSRHLCVCGRVCVCGGGTYI